MTHLDWHITHAANGYMVHHDGMEDVLGGYEHAGIAIFILVLLTLLVVGGPRLRRAAACAGVATGIALLVGQILSRLVDRPRPFITHAHAVTLFSPHVADPGFPSDHATGAFAIAASVVAYDRRWGGVLLVLAAVLSVGRVALGVHYPTDVIAGAALGVSAALLVIHTPLRRHIEAIADRFGDRTAFRLPWA